MVQYFKSHTQHIAPMIFWSVFHLQEVEQYFHNLKINEKMTLPQEPKKNNKLQFLFSSPVTSPIVIIFATIFPLLKNIHSCFACYDYIDI
jgi:hypothetical protein